MATFVYEAIDPMGRMVKSSIEADSEGLVLSKLHDQNFHVLSVSQRRGGSLSLKQSIGKPKMSALVVFSRQFATMIDAGISVLKCLDILEGQAKDIPLRTALAGVRKDVKGGMSLGDSLAKYPTVFNKLYVNMVRAAELGGILDTILDRLAMFLEKEQEITQKVRSAMMYPLIVLVFSQLIIVALFLFVLPVFKEIFAGFDLEMPLTTQILFFISDALVHYWFVPLIAIVALVFATRRYYQTPQGRMNLDRLKLKIPIVGDMILKMSISRFARTFGTLISAGVPMLRSLEIVGETSGNAVITKAIADTRSAIREGQRISVPLTASGLFPTMVTTMVDIGEETGRLSEMLVKVSDFYDSEVDALVKGLTSMIEPILIVFMGVVVGFIAISIMSPMFSLVSHINK